VKNDKKKIFCIGFPRTGTTTLSNALSKLGYMTRGGPDHILDAFFNNDLESIYKFVDQNDAFQDNPWFCLYKELDKRYPGSKFILTERESDKWLRSIVGYTGNRTSRMGQHVLEWNSLWETRITTLKFTKIITIKLRIIFLEGAMTC